jgi:TetR/AcrR family transcriptional repressor of bet genes
MTPERNRPARRNAAERILQGAAKRLIDVGAADTSLHDVAVVAGVSKALIHYHFASKEALLVRVAEWATAQLVTSEGEALQGVGAATAVDALWQWLEGELANGHLRLLLELGVYREPLVQGAVREAVRARQAAAMQTIDRLFALLELRPRVPTELLAGVVVAFADGLASRPGSDGAPDARIAFDIFWLSLLSLAE